MSKLKLAQRKLYLTKQHFLQLQDLCARIEDRELCNRIQQARECLEAADHQIDDLLELDRGRQSDD